MGSVAFDTLKAAKQLGEAGFEPEQAEALVTTFAGELNDNLVTKEDLERVEERLVAEHRDIRKDMKALDTKIDTSFKELDTKIDTSIKTLDAKIDTSFKELDTKIDTVEERLVGAIRTQGAELRQEIAEQGKEIAEQGKVLGNQIAELKTDIATGQASQLRWMIGSTIAICGVLVAALAAFQ